MQNSLTSVQDQQSATGAHLEEHDEQLTLVLDWKEQQMNENEEILLKLVSVEKMLNEELLARVEGVEERLVETDDKVEQLELQLSKVKMDVSETGNKVKELERAVSIRRTEENKPG